MINVKRKWNQLPRVCRDVTNVMRRTSVGCQDGLDEFKDNGSLPHCDVFGMLCIIKTRGTLD